MTELKEHMSFFERQDWSIPSEFTELCVAAESKDEKLRELIDKKLTPKQMDEVIKEINKEKIKTVEMKFIVSQCERAKRWIEHAKSIRGKWVAIKTLQKIVNDCKGLQLITPLIEETKTRYNTAHDWYYKKYNSLNQIYKLIKNSKTRT